MKSLQPPLGRTLVLVAHPDDEAVACGTLLQRIADPIVVFATDGAPRSDFFWSQYGSRAAYAEMRAKEAQCALAEIGVSHFHFLTDPAIVDQELYRELERGFRSLSELIQEEMPDAILTLAYEAGHPDHDSCSFLASLAKNHFGLPVWEAPIYHRDQVGKMERQQFIFSTEYEITLRPTFDELARKRVMFAAYRSQADVLSEFDPEVERFRPLATYDFSRPPHPELLNYEVWQWPMRAKDLCRAFVDFRKRFPSEKFKWRTAA